MSAVHHEREGSAIAANVRAAAREWASFYWGNDCWYPFGLLSCYLVNAALALPVALILWLRGEQETYGNAFGLSFDLLFTAQFSACAIRLFVVAVRERKQDAADYLAGVCFVSALAGVALWNFAALYLGSGLPPLVVRGGPLRPVELLFFAVATVVGFAAVFALVGGVLQFARLAGWVMTALALAASTAVLVTLIVVPSDDLLAALGFAFLYAVLPGLVLCFGALMVWNAVTWVMKFTHSEKL